jgi:anti-sigma regulatory factor (Ser/Thr protein kinase)
MAELLEVRLPVSAKAPGMARRAVRRLVSPADDELRANVALLVSELVSNAVLHAQHRTDTLQFRAWSIETAVRIAVGDSGTGFTPAVVVPQPTDEGHRGLWLIDMLADNWGISVDDRAWSWFEIHAPQGQAPGRTLGSFLDTITDWPMRSKDLAWSMAASLGPPGDVGVNRLTWTTPQCVAAIFCPDHEPLPPGARRRRGLIEDRHGRWWLETLRSQPHHSTHVPSHAPTRALPHGTSMPSRTRS